jgi:hypothetical protein
MRRCWKRPTAARSATSARTSWSAVARRASAPRFASLDELVARAGLRRDEVVTLADIGALNAFGYDRRSRCGRPSARSGRAGSCSMRRAGRAGKAGGENQSCWKHRAFHPAFQPFRPSSPLGEPMSLETDERGRAAGRRLRRHEPAASAAIRWRCAATSWRCAASCAPAISIGASGAARPRRGDGHHPPAPGTAKGFVFPHARGRNGALPTSSSGRICSRASGW